MNSKPNKLIDHRYVLYGLEVVSTRPIALLSGVTCALAQTLSVVRVSWSGSDNQWDNRNFTWTEVLTRELRARKKIRLFTATDINGDVYKRVQYLDEKGLIEFVISPISNSPSSDTEIDVMWHDSVPVGDVESYFVGPFMGSFLRSRQSLCIHASAVTRDNLTVAFAGPKRAGKSTTAAALTQFGWQLVADDILLVNNKLSSTAVNSQDGVLVYSGYGKVRLMEDASLSLFDCFQGRPVYSNQVKQYIDEFKVKPRIDSQSLRLDKLYILDSGARQMNVSDLSGEDKFRAIAANTFAGYMLTTVEDRRIEFKQILDMIKVLPVALLHIESGLEKLADLNNTILGDNSKR